MQLLTRLVIMLFVLPSSSYTSPATAENPDPIALLRGVEQARSEIKSGRVEMKVLMESFVPWSQRNEYHLVITFNGEVRTARQRYKTLHFVGGDHNAELRQLKGDREALVRQGKAAWSDADYRSAWDGVNFCQIHSDGEGASYQPTGGGTSAFIFDPRLLGLLHLPLRNLTLAHCMNHHQAEEVRVVGKDNIAGRQTWHVLVRMLKHEKHFWIENQKPYRVHKFILLTEREETVVTSTYPEQAQTVDLPTEVVMTRHDRKLGKDVNRWTVQVTDAKLNIPISPQVGTLASLILEPGEEVADERIHRRLGYWNGTGLSSDLNVALLLGRARRQAVIDGVSSYIQTVLIPAAFACRGM